MQINKIISNNRNFSRGRKDEIRFIVIHYTGNNGDTAKSNCNYFKSGERGSSAHYFVDDKEILQSVEDFDTAWHCGTSSKYYHKYCRNENSIGVELCSRKDKNGRFYFTNDTIKNAIIIIKFLSKKYNINYENIIRHYDVTHKICPAPFVKNEESYINFKNTLKEDEEKYMFLKRDYQYNNNKVTFNVINEKGENYIRVRDLAELLGREIFYDDDKKLTILK